MIWSPSTTLPSRVDREAAVGVAVVGDADIGAVLEHGLPPGSEVGRADAVVDVHAVGIGADHGDLGRPASRKVSGETPAAAPWAQSSTTWMPSRRFGSVPSRCTT